MFEVYRKEVKFGGKKLTFETGKVARQADGAVVVTYGGTTVLCTATAAKNNSEADFFLLQLIIKKKLFQPERYQKFQKRRSSIRKGNINFKIN